MSESKLEKNHLQALLAGHAIVTFRWDSGTRYTYEIVKKSDEGKPPVWFVSLLTGPENESSYTYIGMIQQRVSGPAFKVTAKSAFPDTVESVRSFALVLDGLIYDDLPDVEIWYSGHCLRCGRLLTVPESIAQGYGPECIELVNQK